jgi:hypothetical protein
METFAKLFGQHAGLVYHCFDRVVILGHLALLTRPENIVHFFRDVHQVKTIDKEILRRRTDDYHRWEEAFVKKRKVPRPRRSCPSARRDRSRRNPASSGPNCPSHRNLVLGAGPASSSPTGAASAASSPVNADPSAVH